MASPWKFLARLTSGWGERQEPKDGLTDNAKLEEAASPEPVEAIDDTQNSSDRLVEGETQPADQSVAEMTVPEHSAEAGSRVQGRVGPESALDAAGPALSDDADFTAISTHDVLTSARSKKRPSAKRKRSQEASAIKSVEVFPQVQASVPTFPDEVQSLDKEIRLLRDQLARKLQLQNAQLRILLERFER